MGEHTPFTPGPWRISGEGTVRAGDGWVCKMHWHNRRANAAVVAAAPDLLAAAIELVKRFDSDRHWHNARGGDDYPDSSAVAQARAAIQAATGAKT